MQLTLTFLAAVLGLLTVGLLWRLLAVVATLRAEMADHATVTWALLDELLGEWDATDEGGADEDEPEPDGVQVASVAAAAWHLLTEDL